MKVRKTMNNIDLMKYWINSSEEDYETISNPFIKEIIDTGIKVA